MIPNLVERDLLITLFPMRGFCQKDKGSAGADPRNYKGGSVRWSMVLLAMIPKLVERVLLHVFHLLRGSCQKIRVLPAMIPKLVEKDLLNVLSYMRGFC